MIVFLSMDGCSALVVDKIPGKNVIDDGVYACAIGAFDPTELELSLDGYLNRHDISKTDEPSPEYIYLFATVHSDDKKD